jgi:IS4 transposase
MKTILCFKRFGELKSKIRGNKVKDSARLENDTTSWTRTRAMPLKDVIMCAIGKKALTGLMEIWLYFKEIKQDAVSKQDYFACRKKLNYEVFEELNCDYLKSYYDEDEPYLWNNFLVLAIDGSDVEISNSEENRDTFGVVKTEYGESVARASMSCINDVFNQFFLDIQVNSYKSSETVSAKENIKSAKKIIGNRPVLIIFDRGYPSLEFIDFLEKHGITYLIRLRETDFRKERNNMRSTDEDVKIVHTYDRLFAIRKRDPVSAQVLLEKGFTTARIVETDIGKVNEKKGWSFITNLSKNISSAEIGELYWKRWNIEKKFHTLKNKMKFESNTGKASIYVRQDFWAQVLAFNMVQDLIHSKEAELKEKSQEKNYTYEVKINENIAIGLFKEQLIKLMIEDNSRKRGAMFDKLTDDILKNIVPVRPNLPWKERKWNQSNKYKCNQKPSY